MSTEHCERCGRPTDPTVAHDALEEVCEDCCESCAPVHPRHPGGDDPTALGALRRAVEDAFVASWSVPADLMPDDLAWLVYLMGRQVGTERLEALLDELVDGGGS